MLVITLALIAGFQALLGVSFITRPPTEAPVDTIGDCASWVVAQPSDDCGLLAKRNQVPLSQLLSYNPALKRNCQAHVGLSYCKEKKNSSPSHDLAVRQGSSEAAPAVVDALINQLFVLATASTLLKLLWTARVTPRYNSLSYADLADYLHRSPDGQEILAGLDAADYIACNLPNLQPAVRKWLGGGPGTLTCICFNQTTCCLPTDTVCPVDPGADAAHNGDDDAPGSSSNLRFARSSILGRPANIDDKIPTLSTLKGRTSTLQRRTLPRYDWSATRNGQTYTGSFTAAGWPGPSEILATDWIWQHAYAMDFNDDCTALTMVQYTKAQVANYLNSVNAPEDEIDYVGTEHWFEKNLPAKFAQSVVGGVLASGAAFPAGLAIPPTFFSQFMNTILPALANVPTFPGGQASTTPIVRLMRALGTRAYPANFMVLQARVNNAKASFFAGADPVDPTSMANAMAGSPRLFITNLRMGFNLINYLNDADALDRGEATIRALRWELYSYQTIYNQQNGVNIDVVAAFDIWFLDYIEDRFVKMQAWLISWITDGASHYGGNTDPDSQTLQAILALYMTHARQLGGWNSLGYPTGTPTSYTG